MYKLFCLTVLISFVISCDQQTNVSSDQGDPKVQNYEYSKIELPQGLNQVFNEVDIQNSGTFTIGANGIIKRVELGNIVSPSASVQINNDVAKLGRVLFYDKKLSLNNAIACGSCHLQSKGFSDGTEVSVGFQGRKTERNSMAIVNPISQNNLFWDSRSQSIEDLSLRPVQNHIEMGMADLDYLSAKLAETDYYKPLFKEAFGTTDVNSEKISAAITQFVASITSNNTKFDQMLSNKVKFTALENEGMVIFHSEKAKCSGCHNGGNFSAPDGVNDPYGGGGVSGLDLKGTTNIGLDLVSKDKGKVDGSFKIPSLRNIMITAPYMHDGRFKTLEQVLDHYTNGIKANAQLDSKFRDSKGNPKGLSLNAYEKKAIIAFLNTLTDNSMITNPKYSDPFKN
jgi:cytochrome c peroxidase